jgi:hypothetical protein
VTLRGMPVDQQPPSPVSEPRVSRFGVAALRGGNPPNTIFQQLELFCCCAATKSLFLLRNRAFRFTAGARVVLAPLTGVGGRIS